MEELEIIGVDDHIFQLQKSGTQEKIDIMFEFYGINMPKVGDKMLIHTKMLDKTSRLFVQPYAFELTNKKSDQHYIKEENMDYMMLCSSEKIFILKRIYG